MENLVKGFNHMDTSQKMLYAFGSVVGSVVTVVALRKLFSKEAKEKKKYPRDTVILHQFNRGQYAPNMSPFPIKLETYLRMAKIRYQNVFGMTRSYKGKMPWIEYNEQEIADSTLCIEFLNKKLGVDLNRNLCPADKGVAQAMQIMGEEHLYWIITLFRWQYDNDKSFIVNTFKFGRIFHWMVGRKLKKQSWSQGLGRHTEAEVTEMMKKDLQSLSDFIGEILKKDLRSLFDFIGTKKFLMGDEPCETDCSVFGHLAQFYWQFMGTGHDTIIKDKYPNLAAYCESMKETFWPDWDQCITHGGTREATK